MPGPGVSAVEPTRPTACARRASLRASGPPIGWMVKTLLLRLTQSSPGGKLIPGWSSRPSAGVWPTSAEMGSDAFWRNAVHCRAQGGRVDRGDERELLRVVEPTVVDAQHRRRRHGVVGLVATGHQRHPEPTHGSFWLKLMLPAVRFT